MPFVSPRTFTGVSPERLELNTYEMISLSASSCAMNVQSQAVRVFFFACTRMVVSSACTISFAATTWTSRAESGASASAARWKRPTSVERSSGILWRRYCFACRWSGIASAHFETVICARKPGS